MSSVLAHESVSLGLIKLMRPKQWIKNSFVLAPLVFSGEFVDPFSVGQAVLATLFFCVGASAVYIVNDYYDVEYDRRHPVKAGQRPLASGQVSRPQGLALAGLLSAILFWGAFQQPDVIAVIGCYIVLNVAYTLVLKHQPVIDLFAIASGFVLRVYGGAVALDVPVSSWMFVTTLCLALYLASIKRRQELAQSGTEARKVLMHYSGTLIDRYAQMSATGALLFYSLFVMTERPALILTIPFVLFGLFRYWFVVDSLNNGSESPTDALLSDWQLLLTVLVWAGLCTWMLWSSGA